MQASGKKPDFEILNQFVKDLSFEAPSSPKIFFDKIEGSPNIEIGLEVKTAPAGEKLFEVVLNLKIKNTLKESTLFLIELSYAAMAVVNTEDAAAREKILIKTVPAHLFPFVRAIVADLTRESGFNPFILQPINFDEMKAQQTPPPASNHAMKS
ncbi:MAG: protein-export chaperone SecB [Rickettsiales bacterium]|jgi:preprotein translocase subunit SecB|nr:protein-export chaperone SecB [Rickettsiales bacterium]